MRLEGVEGYVYVGIRAEDDSGNLGRISNLVSVNIPCRGQFSMIFHVLDTLNHNENAK